MNEEVDAELRDHHVSSADDDIDVPLAGRALDQGSDDTDVIDHEDDSLSS